MKDGGWPWRSLGLSAAPAQLRDIKRAYAKRLKVLDTATQAQEFQELRTAYEAARQAWELEQAPAPALAPESEVESASRTPAPFPASSAASEREREREPTPSPDWTRAAEHERESGPEPLAFIDGPPTDPGGHVGQEPAPDHQVWLEPEPEDEPEIVALLDAVYDHKPPLFERWSSLLAHPRMQDVEFAEQMEAQMLQFVYDHLDPELEDQDNARQIDLRLVRLLDERFGWMSDYPSFSRSFPRADAVLLRIQAALEKDPAFDPDLAFAGNQQGWRAHVQFAAASKPGTPWARLRERVGVGLARVLCVAGFLLFCLSTVLLAQVLDAHLGIPSRISARVFSTLGLVFSLYFFGVYQPSDPQ